jgi:hypothetical protein
MFLYVVIWLKKCFYKSINVLKNIDKKHSSSYPCVRSYRYMVPAWLHARRAQADKRIKIVIYE